MRALVAGGTGFLGSAIGRELADRGNEVLILTRQPGRVSSRVPGAVAREGDVTRPETLPVALRDAELVVQCVQFQGFPVESAALGRTFMAVDGAGTENLARAAREAGIRRLVYLSGVGADPDSSRVWYRAKARAERAVIESGLEATIVRPSWVYGPGDRSLNLFVRALRLLPFAFPQLGNGRQRLNPVFVEDVARVVADLAERPEPAETPVELGGPDVFTMDEIVGELATVLGLERGILHVPIEIAELAGTVLELLPGQLLSRDAVRFVVQGAVADNGPLRRLFPGFRPTPFAQALASYLGPAAGPEAQRDARRAAR